MLIPFREVMYQWLYDPVKGYYTHNHIGRAGDFYTSVSVSKFFGGAISRYILKMLEEGRLKLPLYIVEIGSNNGDLITDIAEFLKAFSEVVFNQSTFCTLEPLQTLHELQIDTFKYRITARFKKQLHVYKDMESLQCELPNNIFFVSNELFDSMPCDIIHNDSMLYLHDNKFVWQPLDSMICKFKEIYAIQNAEISLSWETFIQQLCKLNCEWIFLTFDYGDFTMRELNVRMYKQHRVYNLYEELQGGRLHGFIGNSDITYDVDFSLLCDIFKVHNITKLCNVTQSKFLIESCEILDIFDMFSKQFNDILLTRQKTKLQGLISPNAMGERFKALCVGKI